jgi:lipid-binding SYLF domain-containing protein
MKKSMLFALVCVGMTLPAAAQDIEHLVANSTEALREILAKPDAIPQNYLNRSVCLLSFPKIKQVGTGTAYARGVIICRTGSDMTGPWSAPAIYKFDIASLAVQPGNSSTDYIFLIQTRAGALDVLSGKVKVGANISAVAGPTGAKAFAANATDVDVFTYSRAKGVLTGVALPGLSLDSDGDANKAVYGRDVTAAEIVRHGAVTPNPAGQWLIGILANTSPKLTN